MNSNEKFEQIYSEILKNNMSSLEKSRSEAKNENLRHWIIIITIAIIGVILYFILYNMYYPYDEIAELFKYVHLIIFIIVSIMITSTKRNTKTSNYKNNFKSKIIKSLLDSFGENVEYYQKNGISSAVYDKGEFENYDLYFSKDLISGTLKNNCKFSMAQASTSRQVKDNDGTVTYQDSFCGIISTVEIPKTFNTALYIKKDIKDKNILIRTFNSSRFDNIRVELDSQEFEKVFDVYCSNKIIALQLLTADIMQFLIDFYNEMHIDYEITIKNNQIYIRFMSGKMFEAADLQKFSLDKNTIYKYYKMLDFSFTLANLLSNLITDTEI